jgi:uncharacterized membrane protein
MRGHRIAWIGLASYAIFLASTLAWHGYWADEFHTMRAVKLPWGEMVVERASNGHPPLYYCLEKLWMTAGFFVGECEFTYRLPSVLFSIASVALVFRMVNNEHGALAAAAASGLLACSATHLLISQLARSYALLELLMVIQCSMLVSKEKSSWRRLTCLAIVSGAALATHGSASIAVGSQILATLAIDPKRWRESLAMSLGGACYVLFAFQLKGLGEVEQHIDWINQPTFSAWARFPVLLQFGRQISVVPNAAQVICAIGFVASIYRGLMRSTLESHLSAQFAIVWASSAIAAALGFGICHVERYFTSALVCQCVVTGIVICKLSPRASWKTIFALLVAGAISITSLSVYLAIPPFAPWRSMAITIKQELSEGEIVQVMTSPTIAAPFAYYYSGKVEYTGRDSPATAPINSKGLWLCFRLYNEDQAKRIPESLSRRFPNKSVVIYGHGALVHVWR